MLSKIENTILDIYFFNFNFYIQPEMEKIDNIQKNNINKYQTYICQQRQNLIIDDVPMLSQLENIILSISFSDINLYIQSKMQKNNNI